MKTQPNREKAKELSDAEFEAALHSALRDEGHFFPQNEEDVAALKATVDMDGVPTPDTQRFGELLRESADRVVELPNTAKAASREVEENLAMAARNGSQISDEIKKRMDEDRAKARGQMRKKHEDGAR